MKNYKTIFLTAFSVFIFVAMTLEIVYSRGGRRGGGGGVSRSGPARSGSMNHNRANRSQHRNTTASANRGNRQHNRSTSTENRQANRSENRDERSSNRDDVREDRQEYRDDTREDRQDYRDDVRDDRQDFADDVIDDRRWYYDDNDWWELLAAGAVIAVGTAVVASAFQSTSCPESSMNYNNTTYYACGGSWFTKGYQSGEVVYIAAETPPGY